MRSFEGKKVVVAGGSSGIGLATAEAFARLGADIGLIARDHERLEIAREAVEQQRAGKGQVVTTASADLSDGEQTGAAFDQLAAAGIVPDVLVNSAGVILPGHFTEMPIGHFEDNMASYWAIVHACRAIAPTMLARGSGDIVNVGSAAGFLPIYGYTAYAAAKYAIMGFTEALRFEMHPAGIHVHVVCPPDTDTPGLAFEKTLRPHETDVVSGKVKPVPPSQVADAIVRCIGRNRFYVIPDATTRLYFRAKGLLPELFFAIVDSDVKKARRG